MKKDDQERFKRGLAAVMATHPNAKPDLLAPKAYWLALKDRLSIEDFEDACKRLMVDDRSFPPRPRDFIDATQGDLAIEAQHWWERFTDFSSRSGPYEYRVGAGDGYYVLSEPIPERARFALNSVGGPGRLAMASQRDLDFHCRQFKTAYRTAANHEIERPNDPLLHKRVGDSTPIGDMIPKVLQGEQAE